MLHLTGIQRCQAVSGKFQKREETQDELAGKMHPNPQSYQANI